MTALALACQQTAAALPPPPRMTASPHAPAPDALTVSGTVIDPDGETVIGAVVREKGTDHAAVTDIDGHFTLKLSSPKAVITITHVGMETLEQPVKAGESGLELHLKSAITNLEEVVVVGFGTQKKVNLTGAVSVATGKEIASRPTNNLSQALQGMLPGLQLTGNTGDVESTMSVSVRGKGTIGAGSSDAPLVLVDGMEGDINSVNPQDVESISVLKDAASASIYGSRAAFGVILITTKKGAEGKPTVNYSASFRFTSPIRIPEAMNSYVFANYFNQAARNAGWGEIFSQETMRQMIDFQVAGGTTVGGLLTDGNVWGKPAGDPFTTGYANTDWYKELYKSGVFSEEHNASVSGGSKTVSYYASLSFLDYNGMLRHGSDKMQRYTATGKINAELAPWLRFGYTVKFIREDYRKPTKLDSDLYNRIGRQTWPNLPVYDENGFYHSSNAETPAMQLALGGEKRAQQDRLYQQASLIFEPVKNWLTHVEFNYCNNDYNSHRFTLPVYDHDLTGREVETSQTSSVYMDYHRDSFLNWNIYSDYTFTVADGHNFKVMAGLQAEENRQKHFSAEAYGLLNLDQPEINLTSGLDGLGKVRAPDVGGYHHKWSTLGFFGRINYDYQGKYLIEGNLRYDGSSRFRSGKRWTWSPSVSLGWNIAEEKWWQDFAPSISQLKLRASYGTLSNQNTFNWYPTYRTIAVTQNSGQWLIDGRMPNTSVLNELVSESLTWERVKTWNFGLDFGLFRGRLKGSLDAFIRSTDDMVGPALQLPNTLGTDPPRTNNCDLRTVGWELTLTWRDRLNCGLEYGITANLSDSRTKITSFPGNTTGSISTYNTGRYTGEIWGFETVGIAQSQAEMDAHLQAVGGQSALGSQWSAGDIMYRDLDGRPGISKGAQTLADHGDLKVIGDTTPRYLFGLDLTAAYKGFDIRAFVQGVAKRDFFNSSPTFWGVVEGQWQSVAFAEHGDYWRDTETGIDGYKLAANTDSYYPRPVFGTTKNQQIQTRYLQNAAYLRMKNLQIGYTLPEKISGKFYCKKLRVYASADNLFTITSMSKLFDPERIDGGFDDNGTQFGNSYPLSRTLSVGLSATF